MRADGFTWSIYSSELSLSAEQALLYWMLNLFPPVHEFFTIGWASGKHDNTSILRLERVAGYMLGIGKEHATIHSFLC